MALHRRATVARSLDSVYAGSDLSWPLPKYRFPGRERAAGEAFQLVSDELILDGNARQNLATFCQTWEEPRGPRADGPVDRQEPDRQGRVPPDGRDRAPLRAHAGRPVERARRGQHRRDLDHRVVRGLHAGRHGGQVALAGAPRRPPASPPTGRTWCAGRSRWSGTSSPGTGTSRSARCPWRPAATAWTSSSMLERVDENTIFVVPTFGVTYTGAYEPVAELSAALDDLQQRTGLDVDIHVDGASGGFLAPFCAPEVAFDFRLPRVKSISTSGHKFGLAPLGVGLGGVARRGGAARGPHLPRQLPGRRHAGLPDQLLAAGRPDHRPVLRLHPPRPGGLPARPPGVATTRAAYLAEEIAKLGPFELLAGSDPRDRHPVGDMADHRGGRSRLHPVRPGRPAAGARLAGPRLHADRRVVRHRRPAHPGAPGRDRDLASILLDDLRDSIAHFATHPVSVPMGARRGRRLQPPVARCRPPAGRTRRRRGRRRAGRGQPVMPWTVRLCRSASRWALSMLRLTARSPRTPSSSRLHDGQCTAQVASPVRTATAACSGSTRMVGTGRKHRPTCAIGWFPAPPSVAAGVPGAG